MFLVFYDISSDPIRTKIAKRLVAEGYERIQLSVFTGLRNPKSDKTLWKALNDILEAEPEAKFYIIRIPPDNFRNLQMIGSNPLDIEYLLGEKYSLFI